MKVTTYKKRDGSPSTIKIRNYGNSYSYSPSGVMKGSSMRVGSMTTFSDAAYKPKKYGIKMNNKTTYFNPSWQRLK